MNTTPPPTVLQQSTDAASLGANFSSQAERQLFVAREYNAAKARGLTEEAAQREADRAWDVHFRTVLIQGWVRNALADAIKDLPKQQQDLMKKAGNEFVDVLKAGGMADVGNNEKARNEWRTRFAGHQDKIISGAIESGMAPYEAMAGLSKLGIFFGGIASFIGQATGNQNWVNLGQSTMAQSVALAQTAQAEILKLKPLAEQVTEAPPGWRSDIVDRSNFSAQAGRYLIDAARRTNNPALIAEMERLVYSEIVDQPYPGKSPSFSAAPGAGGRRSSAAGAGRGEPSAVPTVAGAGVVRGYTQGQIDMHAQAAAQSAPTAVKDKYGKVHNVESYVLDAAQKFKIDPRELRLRMSAESSFNPSVQSSQGAGGIAQFVEGTAKRLGIKDRFDPQESVYGMAGYLRTLYDQHKTSYAVDMAYYGGDANRKSWGPNTYQYANNLMAVRGQIYGSPVVGMDRAGQAYEVDQKLAVADTDTKVAAERRGRGGVPEVQPSFKLAAAKTPAPAETTGSRGMKQGTDMHARAPEVTRHSDRKQSGQTVVVAATDPRALVGPAPTIH